MGVHLTPTLEDRFFRSPRFGHRDRGALVGAGDANRRFVLRAETPRNSFMVLSISFFPRP